MKEILEIVKQLTFTNLDLLSVGITIAAIAILGFIVYISNTKSKTNAAFLMFCVVTMLWSFFNYISYQTPDPEAMLLLWKIVIFLATWHAFSFFHFLYVFPREYVIFPKWYTYVLVPYVTILSLLALLGKLVFSGVTFTGVKPEPIAEKGIVLFMITVSVLVFTSFCFLVRNIVKVRKNQKKPYIFILVGAILTFTLLFTFNLILPAVFEIIRFIPLGAISIFPFVVFTTYAIYKHKTFKVRHISAAVMAFLLCVTTFIEIIFAESSGEIILRSGIFLFVLLISIQFIKNILQLEVLTEKLEDANERLQSLDKLKSEFISLASHQLRSPLTVIKGYASTLIDGVVGDLTEKQKEIVNHMYVSADGLAHVVEDFLSVTKIEQGGMQYSFEKIDLKKLVYTLAEDMKIAANNKKLTLVTDIDNQGAYQTTVDVTKIRQVFLNIIDNSIKYTKEGVITVSLKRGKKLNTFVFSVTDTGSGFSEETKKHLFTKFGRGDSAHLNNGGSGLGLYLAQEIVKAHHGTICAESKGVGKGAEFSVTLPVA